MRISKEDITELWRWRLCKKERGADLITRMKKSILIDFILFERFVFLLLMLLFTSSDHTFTHKKFKNRSYLFYQTRTFCCGCCC